jgi:hypothetical protein
VGGARADKHLYRGRNRRQRPYRGTNFYAGAATDFNGPTPMIPRACDLGIPPSDEYQCLPSVGRAVEHGDAARRIICTKSVLYLQNNV